MLTAKISSQIVPVVLLVGAVVSVAALAARVGSFHLPGNNEGYSPEQPIAFSHRLHAGELLIDCLYCHSGAETSRHAGIPAASVCMNCHKFITAAWGAVRAEDDLAAEEGRKPERIVSPELQTLYTALALDETMKRDPERQTDPLEWVKVHNLPDFVFFDHRPHVNAGVSCQRCHGPV
ncbi:MAG: cytochrome c family protein, partial [Phycisphaerales bacterium]|nr:cytochrome c family protein [Phycisphaerales bacterium]